ncbi:unnamed protein product, partial [Chrysoparadoxa australica]
GRRLRARTRSTRGVRKRWDKPMIRPRTGGAKGFERRHQKELQNACKRKSQDDALARDLRAAVGYPDKHFPSDGEGREEGGDEVQWEDSGPVGISQAEWFEMPSPGLPHIDDHLPKAELHFESIGRRNAAKLERPRTVAVVADEPLAGATEADGLQGFCTEEEIERVIKWMGTEGEGDGEISLPELTRGFRRVRRARAHARRDQLGIDACAKLLRLIERAGMNLEELFQFMDQSQDGQGDGKLTVLELRQGFLRLYLLIREKEGTCRHPECRRRPNYGFDKSLVCSDHVEERMVYLGRPKSDEDPQFSKEDLQALLAYCDKNGTYDIDHDELKGAMDRMLRGPEAQALEVEAGKILGKLENHIKRAGIRLKDLFNQLDADGSGRIDKSEFRTLLEHISRAPLAQLEAQRKKKEKLDMLRKRRKDLVQAMSAVMGRLDRFKISGTYGVLKRLAAWQKTSGMRIVDAFTRSGFDYDGDGCLSDEELVAFMHSLKLHMMRREARQVLKFLDDDESGAVEVTELYKAVRQLHKDEMWLNKIVHDEEAMALIRDQSLEDDEANIPCEFLSSAPTLSPQEFGSLSGLSKKSNEKEEEQVECEQKANITIHSGSMLDGHWLVSFEKGLNQTMKSITYL